MDTSREIREFPQKLAREAGIEKDLEDLRRSTRGTLNRINRAHSPIISPIEKRKEEDENVEVPESGEDK